MSALSQWQEEKQEKKSKMLICSCGSGWFVSSILSIFWSLHFHVNFLLGLLILPIDPWVNAGWGQLNTGFWRCLLPNPRNLQRLPYMVKGYFADMTQVKILRWEGHLELSQWALNIIISILRGRQQGHAEQWEVLQQSRRWNDGGMGFQKLERQGNRFSPRVSRRHLAQHLDFSPGKLISGFWPLEKNFVLS